MPSSNMPEPDKIPDMSLGERLERTPSNPAPLPDAASIQPQQGEPLRPSAAPRKYDEPEPSPRWKAGDDVLAPWEPTMLYPGTIKQVTMDDARGDQALIAFDDGGEGWVFLYSLCPFEFKVGQQVQVRRDNGQTYYHAEILEVSGGEVRVRFDNGSTEWTRMATLRIPCIANGPGAVATKLAAWQSPLTQNAVAAGGTGVPSWVIWAGIMVVLAFLRIGCRAMNN